MVEKIEKLFEGNFLFPAPVEQPNHLALLKGIFPFFYQKILKVARFDVLASLRNRLESLNELPPGEVILNCDYGIFFVFFCSKLVYPLVGL